jgi:hypothetical protein
VKNWKTMERKTIYNVQITNNTQFTKPMPSAKCPITILTEIKIEDIIFFKDRRNKDFTEEKGEFSY